MKILNNYDNYIVDIILEKFKFDEITLVMSQELISILDAMEHPIAKKLITLNDNLSFKSKITLLDIDSSDDNKLNNISFTTSTKAIEHLPKDFKRAKTDSQRLKEYRALTKKLVFWLNEKYPKAAKTLQDRINEIEN